MKNSLRSSTYGENSPFLRSRAFRAFVLYTGRALPLCVCPVSVSKPLVQTLPPMISFKSAALANNAAFNSLFATSPRKAKKSAALARSTARRLRAMTPVQFVEIAAQAATRGAGGEFAATLRERCDQLEEVAKW